MAKVKRGLKPSSARDGDVGPWFRYDRLIVGFHGTRRTTADALVKGVPFKVSENSGDWLGHGIYFWEHAPQQAWWWAHKRCERYGGEPAVVGSLIKLGSCFDLLDPKNVDILEAAYSEMLETSVPALKDNRNDKKHLDCAVFNFVYDKADKAGYAIESARAMYVPFEGGNVPRLWPRSGVFRGGHIQICVREPANILAVWHVRIDGRYGSNE